MKVLILVFENIDRFHKSSTIESLSSKETIYFEKVPPEKRSDAYMKQGWGFTHITLGKLYYMNLIYYTELNAEFYKGGGRYPILLKEIEESIWANSFSCILSPEEIVK